MSHAIGRPDERFDARDKVTGAVRYTADVAVPALAHAALVTSTVARGRIVRIDSAAAEALPGVRLVLTHRSLNAIGGADYLGSGGRFQSSVNPLASADIAYHGQIVALVVADSVEAAEQAAELVDIGYDVAAGGAALDDEIAHAEAQPEMSVDIGDVDAAFADAAVVVEGEYRTAPAHHNPIELFGTTASWDGDRLHLEVPSQWIVGTRAGVAEVLDLPADDVSVSSSYVGGGFGGKASVLWHTVLTAVAARRILRPVKLSVTRSQGFTVGSFRPATRHRVRLGATNEGQLVGYDHEIWGQTSRADAALLPGTHYSTHIYASPHIRAREWMVATDVNTPGFMRAPIEYPVNFAQESALDELAVALGMDPIELRERNEPVRDPVSGLPYSSRSLIPCFRRGAELFGWADRNPQVGAMRAPDGRRVGWGCAGSWYPAYRAASEAGLRIDSEGRIEVRVSAHDLGTGAYTVLRQIAADSLGASVDGITVVLGASDLPVGPMAAGSSTTASAGSAVKLVCEQARLQLTAATVARPALTGRDPESLRIAGTRIVAPNGASPGLAEIVRTLPGGSLDLTARWAPREFGEKEIATGMGGRLSQAPPFSDTHTMFSFGAQFAEVLVDPLTRRVSLGRLAGVFACGRIVNPRTARSQLIGGMIWGASHALMEEGVIDNARARFANRDLGSYHFAANADIPEVLVDTIDEHDEQVNPLGVKGVGEIGVVGMAAAIASAIHHATGIRLRRTPMLIDDLLAADPPYVIDAIASGRGN